MATKKKQRKKKRKKHVVIGLVTHAHSVVNFHVHFNHMKCLQDWAGKYDLKLLGYKGLMAADAREGACNSAIEEKCTHVFMLDADHFIHANTLDYLLENSDEAMVSGLVCRRLHPFQQVAYVKHDKSGGYTQIELPLDGKVYEVGVCAFGCTLINLKKLQELEKPWFRDTCDTKYDGGLHNIRSDVNLSDAFRANGEKVWIDTRALVIHEGSNLLIAPQNAEDMRHFLHSYEESFKLHEDQMGRYTTSGVLL